MVSLSCVIYAPIIIIILSMMSTAKLTACRAIFDDGPSSAMFTTFSLHSP